MGHCKPKELKDISTVLDSIRNIGPAIVEKKEGVFYYNSKAFLHFHSKDNKRWADIKSGKNWGPSVDIVFNPTKNQTKKFLSVVEKCYKEMLRA